MTSTNFDPVGYKRSTHDQWQAAAGAWRRWQPVIDGWLREGTDLMLDLARVQAGARVLDVAAGAGGQSFAAARRIGPQGEVLATDLSENLVRYLEQDAAAAGLTQVRAAVMDAEDLRVPPERFDAVICRLGLIYLPNREAALRGIRAALRPGGRLGAIVYSTPEANRFFSVPVSIIRRAAQLPPPLPGQPGPFSLGTEDVLRRELEAAGFVDVDVRALAAPLRLASAAECVRFERESFGALHQMLAGLSADTQAAVWQEVTSALTEFEAPDGFEAPCELLVVAAARGKAAGMEPTGIKANLSVPDIGEARAFYTDYLGLSVEEFDMGWVARFRSPDGRAVVQLVTHDATAPDDSVISVNVGDQVDEAYAEAVRRGFEIVHPLTTEPWGIRRFLVRAPDGNVININSHRDD
jgi:SAM-dependent methyltransferase/predicted enzyme related to lactoylglutathione lyase